RLEQPKIAQHGIGLDHFQPLADPVLEQIFGGVDQSGAAQGRKVALELDQAIALVPASLGLASATVDGPDRLIDDIADVGAMPDQAIDLMATILVHLHLADEAPGVLKIIERGTLLRKPLAAD